MATQNIFFTWLRFRSLDQSRDENLSIPLDLAEFLFERVNLLQVFPKVFERLDIFVPFPRLGVTAGPVALRGAFKSGVLDRPSNGEEDAG
jgi:hypothetical protein